jgi:light-regulated signal transduction histidine kinase (bacteriophytochrome)
MQGNQNLNQGGISTDIKVDLTNCDKEPIHIPGSIQPHGVLFVLQEPELNILQVSNNTFQFFGIHPQQLLNQNLSCLLDAEQMIFLQECLGEKDLQVVNPIELSLKLADKNQPPLLFDAIVHRSPCLILELEPHYTTKNNSFFDFYHLVKVALNQFQNSGTVTDICETIVKYIRQLTGFDRVLIYRFDKEWNGCVIAEDIQAELAPFLGLNYPASDIPQQARELYRQNWLRLIPDVDYHAAEIIPAINPITQSALDMSGAVLRSVSPIHIEYLHNMGVTASMSISILKNKQLWGLIACHHHSPKYVPYEIRTACEFLGQIASAEISNKEDNEDYESRIELKNVLTKLLEYMSIEESLIGGLTEYQPSLLNLVNARGAAIFFEDEYVLLGNTPKIEDIQKLLEWVTHSGNEEIFCTNCLSQFYPEAEKFSDVASGLIALSISKFPKNYILWFKPEVLQTVNWGGNLQKPVEITENGSLRLSPRKSFQLWKETVRLKSLPWKQCEVDAVREFRSAIVGVVLRKAEELARLNVELERSNKELDAFAYIASHDLKEPLRGIHNYSHFLLEDYGKSLTADGVEKLKTLIRLTQRMEDLINSLLHYSRLGRVDLSMQRTNMNNLVNHILDMLRVRLEETRVQIRIPRILPTIDCDRILAGEVFSNLISNALKYNDKAQKWIEIGFIDPEKPGNNQDAIVFYIRDNGIGIKEKHLESIFRIFKRLHGQNKYGGGTGAGLTIVKKIVERHHGKIWVESTYGEGSTFYFTLQGEG